MCQYCGCQALESIALLTAEHDAATTLIGTARRALDLHDLAVAAATARRLLLLLEPHTRVEEGALFPAMAGEFPHHVERLLEEHRTVREPLAEAEVACSAHPGHAGAALGGIPADPTWPSRLRAALGTLAEHILTEQDGVFPAALGVLDAAQWSEVDRIRAQVGTALPSSPVPTRG